MELVTLHILLHGFTLCGSTPANKEQWPDGWQWVRMEEWADHPHGAVIEGREIYRCEICNGHYKERQEAMG